MLPEPLTELGHNVAAADDYNIGITDDGTGYVIEHVPSGNRMKFGPDGFEAPSVDTDELFPKLTGGTIHHTAAYTDLDAAITASAPGDTIILQNQDYAADRIIPEQRKLVSSGTWPSISARITGAWTLERGVVLDGVCLNGGGLTAGPNCKITNQHNLNGTITVIGNKCIITEVNGGDITFEAGTIAGVVAGCANVTVTDNGNNDVEDEIGTPTRSVTRTTTDATMSAYEVMLVDASGGPVTVTLPPPVEGESEVVKKSDSSANAVTVATPNAETINGEPSITISASGNSREIISDSGNYEVI